MSSSSGNGGSCRSSRSSSSSSGNHGVPVEKVASLKSLRRIQYCTEFPLPSHLMCNGCSEYQSSPLSHKKGPREDTHTHQQYLCKQPWKKNPTNPADDRYDKTNETWFQKVQSYIDSHFHCNVRQLFPDSNKRPVLEVEVDLSMKDELAETPKCGHSLVLLE
jgi:hypothetical protein